MTCTEIIRNKNKLYTQMTNKELIDAYNASDVYDLTMCKVICARVGMHEDFYHADGEDVDRVMERAIEQLEACC